MRPRSQLQFDFLHFRALGPLSLTVASDRRLRLSLIIRSQITIKSSSFLPLSMPSIDISSLGINNTSRPTIRNPNSGISLVDFVMVDVVCLWPKKTRRVVQDPYKTKIWLDLLAAECAISRVVHVKKSIQQYRPIVTS